MKSLLLLLVVVVAIVGVAVATVNEEIEDECTNFLRSLVTARCWGPCPERRMGLESVLKFLERHVFGQEYALRAAVSALENATMDAPLVLHFAGDNGVGKTHTAKLIGEALFAVQDARSGLYKGVLQMRGNQYAAQSRDAVADIRRRVVQQLYACPRSLVIFDEAELPSPDTMQVWEELLDGGTVEFEGTVAHTNDAIFIFISDFGTEGITRGMSLGQVEECIAQDMQSAWMYGKQETMTSHIIPFTDMMHGVSGEDAAPPPPPEAVVLQTYALVHYLPQNLPIKLLRAGVTVGRIVLRVHGGGGGGHAEAVETLAAYIFSKVSASEIYRHRNYRGVKQFFNHDVLPSITMHVLSLEASSSHIATLCMALERGERINIWSCTP